MKIEIRNRQTNAVMRTSEEFETVKEFVVDLVSKGADLRGADLRNANLRNADLRNAKGIYVFGSIGKSNRMGYAWMEKGFVVFGLGCHFGNKKETVAAIQAKYGKGTTYEVVKGRLQEVAAAIQIYRGLLDAVKAVRPKRATQDNYAQTTLHPQRRKS